MRRALALPLACACLLVSCRTAEHVAVDTAKLTFGTVKVATKTAVGAVELAGTIVKDFAYYAKKAATYKRYHDSRPLHSGDVARVLRRRYPRLPAYRGTYRWPLSAGIVSSEFGRRWGRPHEGIDVAADLGEPVYACAAGRVVYAGHGLRGYGNVVIVRHDSTMTSLYAHNEKLKVRVGEKVKQSQVIALLGSTGHSTGPHVHFELRRSNKPLNPRSLLPKTKF